MHTPRKSGRLIVNPPVASHNALCSYLMNEPWETTGTNHKSNPLNARTADIELSQNHPLLTWIVSNSSIIFPIGKMQF